MEAFRFSREEVLENRWKDIASAIRNSTASSIGSQVLTGDSAYEHVVRTYAALAKGNLWLFMGIYPWMKFYLDFLIRPDGTVDHARLASAPSKRDTNTLHFESKSAIYRLPFSPSWLDELSKRLADDPVYRTATGYFMNNARSTGDITSAHHLATHRAHFYCQRNAATHDSGFRTPPGQYWPRFKEAYYVMNAEHTELMLSAKDPAAKTAIEQASRFILTPEITQAYDALAKQSEIKAASGKFALQQAELQAIAFHEQLNVLQPLIYDDASLKRTMDINHLSSRTTGGWLSPQYKVIFSAETQVSVPELEVVFDAPKNMKERFFGTRRSLPFGEDRMKFVKDIADSFNVLMSDNRPYMEGELLKIRKWLNA